MDYAIAKKLKDAGFPQHDEYMWTPETDLRSATYAGVGFHRVYDSSCGETLEQLQAKPLSEWQGKGRASVYFNPEYLTSNEGKELTVYCPTLLELIEACGDELDSIVHHTETLEDSHTWSANCYEKDLCFIRATLEEALTELWLALNKK